MASYRDIEMHVGDSTLPSIRRHGYRPRSPTLQTIEHDPLCDERYRTTQTTHSRIADRDVLFHPRAPSPTGTTCRRQVLELQDELRHYREEVAQKDRLISDITKCDTPRARVPITSSTAVIDDLYSNERIANIAATKSENAALQVRVESLSNQVREQQVQLESREDKIKELKMQLEHIKESEAKHKALTSALREKVLTYESQYGSLEDAASRSEVAIHSLQRQTMDSKERIIELERRNRDLLEERERANRERMSFESRFTEIIAQFSSALGVDTTHSDTIISRVTDITQENAMLRGKLATMKEYLTSAEIENKASRETIMRLVTEAERDQKHTGKYQLEMDSLRLERDSAITRQREIEREVEVLRDRLDANQRAWDATRGELEDRETRHAKIDIRIRELELQARNQEMALHTFKEQLANILQVEPYEEQIRERVTVLMRGGRDKSAHIEMLEAKVSQLTEKLEDQLSQQRSFQSRSHKLEANRLELEERFRQLEGELSAGDVLRDGMRIDKERYLRFLEHCSQAMKMDPITADLGIDGAVDAILVRAEQLTRLEADALVDRKTHIYNLQRKIKSLKEQMESKDLHMDLLRKKVASLEERMSGSSVLEREKDEEYLKNKKLLKLTEKYKCEINECRLEIRDLKARLLESSDIKNRAIEQEREIEGLASKVGQLERVRHKQAQSLTNLKDEMDVANSHLSEKREVAHNTVQSLSNELHTTKVALQEVTNRERQLLDLRQVIARMLGLDVNTLAVPDYEILARLEKLVLANQSNAATAIALDTALEGISSDFRAGYEDATQALTMATRAKTAQRRSIRTRSRSMSPNRKRDVRSY